MRGDYQRLVDEISAALAAPATLEDRDFRLIAFGVHDDGESGGNGEGGEEGGAGAGARTGGPALDPVRTRSILHRRSTPAVRAWFEAFGIGRATRPLRIPPDPSAGVLIGRICLPVRHRGVGYGYVWLLDDGHLADLETGARGGPPDPRIERAMETAARIGELLAAEARAGAELGELLQDLLTGPAVAREAARTELRARLSGAADGPLALAAVTPWARDVRDGEDGGPVPALSALPGALAVCAVPDQGLAVLVRPRPADSPEPALAAAERLLRSPRAAGAAAGTGAPRYGLEDLAGAWREALAAARAARAEPRLGPVARWEAIGPYRTLTELPPAARADPAVARLLRPEHAELARTAEVFLDCAGQAGRAAAALAIHRQTLYYRLSRVAALTGLDLAEGEDRLLLHMALKRARL
ncbi:helix-turn-helix domain-containing protein [Streptomyces sp. F63]|uniref:PucR family transcriptional regulator n=1 Tax=Streptomyces sp. F63 TaxID=2824887 RepID=UPI001B39692F|nr:helix-turn-helix domain-containing protein [Streptomyces sp. F63]MBQ0984509.1 helix-turn-helix domain-containing protein [Streptomyces sp. F63]